MSFEINNGFEEWKFEMKKALEFWLPNKFFVACHGWHVSIKYLNIQSQKSEFKELGHTCGFNLISTDFLLENWKFQS